MLNYISKQHDLFGLDQTDISQLVKTADYTNPNGLLSFVHYEQRINGVPVFQAELKAGFSRRNEIVSVVNGIVPGLGESDTFADFGSESEVAEKAYQYVGLPAEPGRLKNAERIYFPLGSDSARRAWRFHIAAGNAEYYVVVDAENGTLLWRKNLAEFQTQPATYNVYGNHQSMIEREIARLRNAGCASP